MIVAIAPAGTGQVKVREFREAADVASAIAAFCAEYSPPKDPADFVGLDVGASVPTNAVGIWHYDHDTSSLVTSLAEVKAAKYAAIDARTVELIEQGFVFGGQTYSLSLPAQTTWLGLDQLRSDPALTYPVVVNTLDDGATGSLPDAATVHGFFLTAVGTYRGHKDSGTALKDQVRAAADEAAVNAIVDTR